MIFSSIERQTAGIAIHRLLVPGLVVAGLCVGFFREMLLAYLFGMSTEVEIIRVAMGLPSILSDSLAVSFASVLIPLFLAERCNPNEPALGPAVWAVFFVALSVAVLGWVTMPFQSRVLASGITGPDQQSLILAGRLCWVMFLAVMLSLVLRAMLSVENIVWPGAGSQLFRSGGFIITLSCALYFFDSPTALMAAFGAIAGGLTVLIVHLIAIGGGRRKRVFLALVSRPELSRLKPIVSALGLVILGQLLLSSGRMIDRAIATQMPEGTLATLEYSYGLVMAATALLGTSANLVLAPRIGRALHDTGSIPRQVKLQIIAVSVGACAAGIGLFTLGEWPVRLVFQRGQFDADAVSRTAGVFRLHALALGPLVLSLILTQILIMNGLPKWVFLTAGFKLVVKVGLLAALLGNGLGVRGLAISLVLTELIMVAALGALLLRESRTDI